MPRFDVLTLFDGYFEPLRTQGICRRVSSAATGGRTS